MRRHVQHSVWVLAAALASGCLQATASANTQPVTYFTSGPGNSFTAYVYPSTPAGQPTDDTGPIALPGGVTVTSGFLVLVNSGLDPTDPDVELDQSDWAQVLEFFPSSIELFTAPVTFPGLFTVLGASNFFQDQSPNGPSVFFAGSATYDVFTEQEDPSQTGGVPEPVTVSLSAVALGALALMALRRRRDRQGVGGPSRGG
jgi:hypothetical protein